MTEPAPDDPKDFREAVGEGLVSLNLGRKVSYLEVRRWLLSWGTGEESSPPKHPTDDPN